MFVEVKDNIILCTPTKLPETKTIQCHTSYMQHHTI